MTVFVATDDNFGTLFNSRRVSRDSEVIKRIMEMANKISVSEYSAPLFADYDGVIVSNDPFSGKCENVFVEKEKLLPHISEIEKIVLFKWGKVYPSDTFLDVIPDERSRTLVKREEFSGSSHDKITMEIWTK